MLWNLDTKTWDGTTCAVAGRNLTQTEWKRYLPGEHYRRTCAGRDRWITTAMTMGEIELGVEIPRPGLSRR